MNKHTLKHTMDIIHRRGYSDALIDRCGMWSRLDDVIKKRHQNKYVRYIIWNYDEDEGIVYIELE